MRAAGTHHDRDHAHLARAIAVAEGARARTSPNPAVGCVLVRDDEVIAEGATDVAGGPHAEAVALAAAGSRAAGATAYVTLEPCAHHGRTPPCADALVGAGVARVVYAATDPHEVAGGGAARLRAGGVEVRGGLLAPWVEHQLEGFWTTVTRGRPHVTLKLAQTVDGRLRVDDQEPGRRWLTGPRAREAVHRWRASVDAVLVGSGTVVADDPRLDVRHVPAPAGQPRAVVLDARLRTTPQARVARLGALVITAPDADPAARRALEDARVEVREVPRGDDGHLDVTRALGLLAGAGITSVLAEPGATLAGAMLRAGVVDRLVLHVATDLGEGPLRPAVAADTGTGGADVVPPGWELERLGGAGPDVILHLVTRHHGRPPTAEEA